MWERFKKRKPFSASPSSEEQGDKQDPDIEATEEKTTAVAGAIETEEFDQKIPPPKKDAELEALFEQEEGVTVNYSFNGDDVREGLTIFQAATMMKKNLIYTAVLICVFFVYVVNMIKTPNQTLSMFLAVMCIAVLGIIWIMPKTHIKKIAAAADNEEIPLKMTIYQSGVKIGEEEASFLFAYKKQITLVIETVNLFMVCAGKEQIFLLPKRFLEDEAIEKLRLLWKDAMEEKFLDKRI